MVAPDSCFSALLADRRNELRPLPIQMLGDLRRGNRKFLMQAPTPPVYAIENFSIAGSDGPIAVRAYRPSPARNSPATLYCHGGGFIAGDLDTHDALCRSLARNSNCTVFAIEYRLAPESKFPGAVHDCLKALTWLSENAAKLNIDPAGLAACGDSAGANLVVAATLLAQELGLRVRYLGLIYPITDAACDTSSMHEFSSGYLLTRAAMQWFWSLYLQGSSDASNPLASILRADLRHLPPTTILTAQLDPLRDEGELFAQRLRAAGVNVTLRQFDGMIHGFVGMPHVTPMAESAIAFLADALRAALL